MSKPVVNVAIALLFHQAKVLVGWRTAKQHQGNKYEFPGGKVEQGETAEQACRREVFEEVGVDLEQWHSFDIIQHEYDDIVVNLHLFYASVLTAQLQDIQPPWAWYRRDQLRNLNFPKANQAIIERLYWSPYIKISENLNEIQQIAPETLLYWRIDELGEDQLQQLKQLNSTQLAKLIVNVDLWNMLPIEIKTQIFTIHFKQYQVIQLNTQKLPHGVRCLAACHDLAALQQAQQVGCEAVFLSPVLATESHPDTATLGWAQFSDLAAHSTIPVFALGGLKPNDLTFAQQHHAYGVAGIRAF